MPLLPAQRARPATWLAMSWLAFLLGIGLLAPWLPLPYAAATPDLLYVATPPSWHLSSPAHYLGTDALGRDVLAGLVAGARRLVLLTLPAMMLATLAGTLAGAAAGFWGNRHLRLPIAVAGWLVAALWWALALPGKNILLVAAGALQILSLPLWRPARQATLRAPYTFALPLDSLVLGTITLLGAVPRLILLVALAAGPPPTSVQLIGLLALLAWPEAARLVRSQMLWVRAQPFIDAAHASGLPMGKIWWRHALPHTYRPLLAFAPLSLAALMGLESTLGFLGIGSGPDAVSWGGLLATVRQSPAAWWVALAPGLALLLTLLSLQKVAAASSKSIAK